MNIIRIKEGYENLTIGMKKFILTTEDGKKFECRTWLEKKGEKGDIWNIVIPKEASEICGRTYIRYSQFTNDTYQFETKTTHRENMGGRSWKDRMTEEEKVEYERCEQRMEEIKAACMKRELTEEEKLDREIEKLLKLREALRNKNN